MSPFLYTSGYLCRHTLLLKGATFLPPGSCPLSPLCSPLPYFPSLLRGFGLNTNGSQLQGASTWSTKFLAQKIQKMLQLLIDFLRWLIFNNRLFFLHHVIVKNEKCNWDLNTDALFPRGHSNNVPLLPVAAKSSTERIKMCLIWLALISCLKRIPCRARWHTSGPCEVSAGPYWGQRQSMWKSPLFLLINIPISPTGSAHQGRGPTLGHLVRRWPSPHMFLFKRSQGKKKHKKSWPLVCRFPERRQRNELPAQQWRYVAHAQLLSEGKKHIQRVRRLEMRRRRSICDA